MTVESYGFLSRKEISLCGVVLLILILTMAGNRISVPFKVCVSSCALMYLISALTPVGRFLKGRTSSELFVLGSLFILILLGQVIDSSRVTYPLVSWNMFGAPLEVDSISILQLVGINGAGERVNLYVPQFFPVKHFVIPGDVATEGRSPSILAIVKAVAVGYNSNHRGAPLVRIELGTVEVPIHNRTPIVKEKWTCLESYSIDLVPTKS